VGSSMTRDRYQTIAQRKPGKLLVRLNRKERVGLYHEDYEHCSVSNFSRVEQLAVIPPTLVGTCL
jgi:hypothetical protein